jgi:hypothetical protein
VPFGDDGVPKCGVAQCLGEKCGVSTRQVDKAGPTNFFNDAGAVRVVAVLHVKYYCFGTESLGLDGPESVPAFNDVWTIGHGGGG